MSEVKEDQDQKHAEADFENVFRVVRNTEWESKRASHWYAYMAGRRSVIFHQKEEEQVGPKQ